MSLNAFAKLSMCPPPASSLFAFNDPLNLSLQAIHDLPDLFSLLTGRIFLLDVARNRLLDGFSDRLCQLAVSVSFFALLLGVLIP